MTDGSLTMRQRVWAIWHTRPGHSAGMLYVGRFLYCSCGSPVPLKKLNVKDGNR